MEAKSTGSEVDALFTWSSNQYVSLDQLASQLKAYQQACTA